MSMSLATTGAQADAYRKVKGWYNLYKQHRYIAPETAATLNYNKPQIFYRLFITEIDNISFHLNQGDNTLPFIKLSMTFFNKVKRKFYGRTYTSKAYPLVSQNGYSLADPINVFFYSTIEKGSDNVLIVEATVVETTQERSVIREQNIGWAILEAYDSQGINSRNVYFNSGTPRLMLDHDPRSISIENSLLIYIAQINQINTRITFKILELQGFEHVTHLLDEAILCGADDILPGIAGRALPDSLNEDVVAPRLESTIKVYIEDINVEIPETFENDILRSAQQYRASQYNLTTEMEKKITDVYISERRLLAAYHNSWTAVNQRKFKNVVILHQDRNNRTKPVYIFAGSLDCDGVFSDECATLIFQVECTVMLPKPDGTKTSWNLVLGWIPVQISNLAAGEVIIKENLIKGPGKSPTLQKLYEPHANLTDLITVGGRVNLTKLPRASGYDSPRAVDPKKVGPGSMVMDNDNDIFKLKVLLQEKQKELERIQNQHKRTIDEVRRQGEMEGYDRAVREGPGSPGAGPGYQSPPGMSQGYQSMDPAQTELIEHYKNESTKTRMEVESIKGMLHDIQSQNKMRPDEARFSTNRFDDEKLRSLNDYMTQQSPTKHTADYGEPQSLNQYHTREISRADKALLTQAGIKGVLDNVGDYGAVHMDEAKALESEERDSMKASVLLVQFLAIKASRHAIFRDSIKPFDLGHDNYELPQKVYFTYNFFDLPTTKTETISLEKPQDAGSDSSVLKYGVPYYLVREAYLKTGTDTKEPILRYEIDPSVDQQYTRHLDFAKYLYSKSLTIDIWDAESLMLFGSVKVPLRELMRQGKQIATFSKEFDIIEPNFMRSKGSLQVLLKNVGKQSVNELPKKRISENTGGRGPMFDLTKKKVKSKKKINLPEEFKATGVPISRYEDDDERMMSPEQKKQEMVNRYKMAAIENNMNIMLSNEEFEKERHKRELREISNFRDTKKISTLKASLDHRFKEEKTVNVMFGRTEIIPLEVTNYYSYDTAFTVHVDDPDEVFIGKSECSLISNPAEWKFWVERKGFATPPEWNMISPNTNSFVLRSGEKCEVLLKFMTQRNFNVEYNRDYVNGRVPNNDLRRKIYISKRIVNVTASETNGKVITGTKLEVVPSSPIVDHVFRFFEQENRNVTLFLPSLYHYSMPPSSKPILALNYSKAVVDWLNDREISLQLKIPPAQNTLRFNLMAYNDVYYADLLGNWVIEINSYTGVDVNVNIGQLTSIKMNLPADISRMAKCYVSHPSLGYFPSPFDKPFALTPASSNSITMNVRSFSVKPQTVLVNCVDVGTKELIYAWIVKLIGTEPNVTRKYEITVRCGMDSNQKFIYENRTTSFCIFEFVSSHPDIIQPIEKNVAIEGGSKENVRIRIAGREEPSIAEVCLFASDTEERIFECLLFQIRYVN